MYFAQFPGMESILIALAPMGHSLMQYPMAIVLLTRRRIALQQMTMGHRGVSQEEELGSHRLP